MRLRGFFEFGIFVAKILLYLFRKWENEQDCLDGLRDESEEL